MSSYLSDLSTMTVEQLHQECLRTQNEFTELEFNRQLDETWLAEHGEELGLFSEQDHVRWEQCKIALAEIIRLIEANERFFVCLVEANEKSRS